MADGGDDGPDGRELKEAIANLREDLDAIEARTVHRDELEADLRRYVRRRRRRGHARGWGPYLVLLFGSAMTIAAFYYLRGGWAILAMLLIWLATLGLYVLMVITGLALGLASGPGRLVEAVRNWR